LIAYLYEKLFDIPICWTVEYTESNLRKEVDFITEARNSERAANDFKNSNLGNIYVPKVHWDVSSERVLTTEWIDGVKISDEEGIRKLGFNPGKVISSMVEAFAYQVRVRFILLIRADFYHWICALRSSS
jgi:aarF domain-containing kinase